MNNEIIEWLKDKNLSENLEEIILKIDNKIFQSAGERRLGNVSNMRISYGPSNFKKYSNLILFPKKGLNLVRLQIKVENYNNVDPEICRTEFALPTIREHSHRFIEKEILSSSELTDEIFVFLLKGINN
jgi:hypothetical protein